MGVSYTSCSFRTCEQSAPRFFYTRVVVQELEITPFYHKSAWKNGIQVSIRHLSKSTWVLPSVTMVPCSKASTCSSSKRETRGVVVGATGLLHMGPEAPSTKVSYIKTVFPNMTYLLCLAWAVAFSPLGLTMMLLTHTSPKTCPQSLT